MFKTKQQLVTAVNNRVCGAASGIYSDDFWRGHKQVMDTLKDLEAHLSIMLLEAIYKNYNPHYCKVHDTKQWIYNITDGQHDAFLVVTAHGAGSAKDPLSKYDITAYCS